MSAKVTPRQWKAIETLLSSGDNTQAAAAAGISRQTLYRWLQQPGFQATLRDAEKMALESLSRSLVSMGATAGATIRDTMTSENSPPTLRLRAADIVLARLLQLRELVDLEVRLSRVEELLEKMQEEKT